MNMSNKNLNQVLVMMCMRNQSIPNMNIAKLTEDLVNSQIYAVKLQNYMIFLRSRFKHDFNDFLFCESICIRLMKEHSKEYLKMLKTKQIIGGV